MPRNLIGVGGAPEGDPLLQPDPRCAPTSSARQQLRRAFAPDLLANCRRSCDRRPEADLLAEEADDKVYNIIQLIYRSRNYEGAAKDYEFSRRTMEEHWRAGYNDAVRTLRHPEVLQRPTSLDGVFTFDLAVHSRE